MKNIIFTSIVFLLTSLVVGCEKEVSDQIKGKWQLKTIEDGVTTYTVDTVWYNFQSESLFMYQIYDRLNKKYLDRYGFKTQPSEKILNLELVDYKLDQFLPYTDWSKPTRTFKIEHIDNKNLELSSESKIYIFRRF